MKLWNGHRWFEYEQKQPLEQDVETLSGATLQRISDGDGPDYVAQIRDEMERVGIVYADEDHGAGLPDEED